MNLTFVIWVRIKDFITSAEGQQSKDPLDHYVGILGSLPKLSMCLFYLYFSSALGYLTEVNAFTSTTIQADRIDFSIGFLAFSEVER